jgi:oxygen-independent coproporphyrinogen-3 oxidase
MNADLRPYAQQSVPRYTSYPPATHFGPDVGGARVGSWLATLPADAKLSLYVHVPYCTEICWYCGCHTFAARRDEPVDDYVETIRRELGLVASSTPAHRLASLHWGGGTPNILSPERFARIARHVEFWFDLDDLVDHAIELDPRSLTRAHAQTYAAFGVTRASLGVQDLNEHVQRAIGRVQPYPVVAESVRLLRDAGIPNVNMDLMYGLPAQTVADVRRTVQLAIDLAPQRIAMFGYAHVPWFKKRQRLIDETALPSAEERLDQAAAAREALLAAGYEAIGIDHFARPTDPLARAARSGAAKRSFQGYALAQGDATVGIGPSAISTLPQGYAQNATDVGSWRRAIETGRLAATRGHAFTGDDLSRAAIIEDLMCNFAADLSARGGAGAFAAEMTTLHDLQEDGLVHLDGSKLTIPEGAQPFARIVAAVFDAYRREAPARYSRAI